MRNTAEILEKYFKNFQNYCGELFHKIIFKIILAMFKNNFKKFPNISRNTSDIFENYYFRKYWKYFFKKVMINVLKIWKFFSENGDKNLCKHWEIFREILPRFLSIISKNVKDYSANLENNFMKFCKLYWKFSKIISKKFWRFREILRTFSRSISENFEKYFLTKIRIIFWNLLRIVSEYHGKI